MLHTQLLLTLLFTRLPHFTFFQIILEWNRIKVVSTCKIMNIKQDYWIGTWIFGSSNLYAKLSRPLLVKRSLVEKTFLLPTTTYFHNLYIHYKSIKCYSKTQLSGTAEGGGAGTCSVIALQLFKFTIRELHN